MPESGPSPDLDDPIENVGRYAQRASEYARQLKNAGTNWRAVYERGLRESFRQNDLEGLTAILHFALGQLDGEAQFGEAQRELELVLGLAAGNDDARCLLLSIRASFLVGQGEPEQALLSARASEALLPGATSTFARHRAATYCAAVRCRTLAPTAFEQIEEALGFARQADDGIDFLFLASWYIPYLFALGKRRRAEPWIRAFRIQAEIAGHRWRQADGDSFRLAFAAPGTSGAPETGPHYANWVARWRDRALALRAALLRSDWDVAEGVLEAMARTNESAGSADLDPLDGFGACFAAYAALGSDRVDPPLPAGLHLTNLPGLLAAAEAVGIAGSEVSASAWLKWFGASLPGHVRTSMEWGASRDRIEALLAARAGDFKRARRLFDRAIDWAHGEGYVAEEGIARVQLADLLLHADLGGREQVQAQLRKEGWRTLTSLGIDPTRHAYAVGQGVAKVRSGHARPRLSPRELELLGLLAQGLTYGQAASHMDVASATVQTLAHRIYEKLEASGRLRAIAAARELGIL